MLRIAMCEEENWCQAVLNTILPMHLSHFCWEIGALQQKACFQSNLSDCIISARWDALRQSRILFCTVSQGNGKQMHYLVPVDGNQEENNQPRVIQEANGRCSDKEGKHCAVCPSCLCSLQSGLRRWFLMNSGAIWYGLESGKGTAPQPLWATEKTFLCSAAPVQT